MAELRPRPPYSYRNDPAVPGFDDGGPIAIMDGDCALCASGARVIARLDRERVFRIGRTQSATGAALVRHYGLEPEDPETWLFIEEGRAWSGMEAIIRIGARLGGPGRLLGIMRICPRSVREWLYRRIAHNRYRFGRTDICALPDPELRARLLEFRRHPVKPMSEQHFAILRRHMVEVIGIHMDLMSDELGRNTLDERVAAALREVPRHLFVPAPLAALSYHDAPLPIGFDKTISQPFVGALMIDLLAPQPGESVLEVGTGLGYQAAVLAQLAGRVWSIEIVEEFAEAAKFVSRKLVLRTWSSASATARADGPSIAVRQILVTAAASIRLGQAACGVHFRPSRSRALARTISLRMTATSASFFGLPAATRRS